MLCVLPCTSAADQLDLPQPIPDRLCRERQPPLAVITPARRGRFTPVPRAAMAATQRAIHPRGDVTRCHSRVECWPEDLSGTRLLDVLERLRLQVRRVPQDRRRGWRGRWWGWSDDWWQRHSATLPPDPQAPPRKARHIRVEPAAAVARRYAAATLVGRHEWVHREASAVGGFAAGLARRQSSSPRASPCRARPRQGRGLLRGAARDVLRAPSAGKACRTEADQAPTRAGSGSQPRQSRRRPLPPC